MLTAQGVNEMNRRFGGSISHRLNGHDGVILTRGDKEAEVRPIKNPKNGNHARFRAPGFAWTPCCTEKSGRRQARKALFAAVPSQ